MGAEDARDVEALGLHLGCRRIAHATQGKAIVDAVEEVAIEDDGLDTGADTLNHTALDGHGLHDNLLGIVLFAQVANGHFDRLHLFAIADCEFRLKGDAIDGLQLRHAVFYTMERADGTVEHVVVLQVEVGLIEEDGRRGIAHVDFIALRGDDLCIVEIQDGGSAVGQLVEVGKVVDDGPLLNDDRALCAQAVVALNAHDCTSGADRGQHALVVDGDDRFVRRLERQHEFSRSRFGHDTHRTGDADRQEYGVGQFELVEDEGVFDGEADGAIRGVLSDVLQSPLCLLAVPRQEIGRRGGVVELGDAASSGEWVVAGRALRTTCAHKLVVVVLGIGVHGVVVPNTGIGGVHTEHEHAVIGQVGVPTCLLTILKDEILPAVLGIDAIAGIGGVERPHCEVALGIDDLGHGKASSVALEEGIAGRCARVVQIAARRHQGPVAGIVALSAAFLVVGVVEVGQAEHMGELMADGADAVDGAAVLAACQLGGAGIAAQIDTVLPHILIGGRIVYLAGMGPEQAAVVASHVGSMSGEDEIHHVDRTVAIAVVKAEVDFAVDGIHHVERQLGCPVAGLDIVLASVDCHGAYDVEHRFEESHRVVAEIVAHRTGALHPRTTIVVVAGVVLAIDGLGDDILIVFAVEGSVVILHQHHQATELGIVVVGCAVLLQGHGTAAVLGSLLLSHLLGELRGKVLLHALKERLFGSGTKGNIVGNLGCGHQLPVGSFLSIDIETFSILHDGVAVGSGVEMQVLIADKADGEHRAVGLLHLHQIAL